MNVLITLTTAGVDSGPFNLYSNVDSYVTAFQTNVAKSLLVGGYTSTVVPTSTTTVRVKSTGVCTNYVDLYITGSGTTTTTTTAGGGTTTTTTTLAYRSILLSNPPGEATSAGACAITTGLTKYISASFAITNGLIIYNNTALTSQTYTSDPYTGNYAMLYDNNSGLRYAVTFDGSGVVNTVVSCGSSPTTTTTTTIAQQWYKITNCSTLAVEYTGAYSVGQFVVNQRVDDLASNIYTITQTYSSNPGGSGLFIGNLGATGCPSGTTTTTTMAPAVATKLRVVSVDTSAPAQSCLGTDYPVTLTTVTATLLDQYNNGINNTSGSPITIVVRSNYSPCYGGSAPTTRNIVIGTGQTGNSVNWDSSKTVDCGGSGCLLETDIYSCVQSNSASLPYLAGTIVC